MTKATKLLDPGLQKGPAIELKEALSSRIIDQPEAIDAIIRAIMRSSAGLSDPSKPVANFLMLGPTGTGKTRTVEALAEALVGTDKAVIRIDCGELQHSHDIAKLVGSPPGYIGHKETKPLVTQERLSQFHTAHCKLSFLLFDEVEKANDALWSLMLGIMDKGRLTLGDNKEVLFNQTLVFLTSNLGASQMQALMKPGYGFTSMTGQEQAQIDLAKKISSLGMKAAKGRFTPEFFGRLDYVITYQPLTKESISKILNLELFKVQKRLFEQLGTASFVFTLTPPARDRLVQEGFSQEYGARPLKRVITNRLIDTFASLLVTEQISRGDFIEVNFENGNWSYTRTLAELDNHQLVGAAEMALAADYLLTSDFTIPVRSSRPAQVKASKATSKSKKAEASTKKTASKTKSKPKTA